MTDTPRYCVDCAFFRTKDGFGRDESLEFGTCSAAPKRHHVISPDLDKPSYAESMRLADFHCGPEAKWFQPKIKEAAE